MDLKGRGVTAVESSFPQSLVSGHAFRHADSLFLIFRAGFSLRGA